MSQMLELPDEVYNAVKQAADASGTTVVDLLRQRFGVSNGQTIAPRTKPKSEITEDEKQAARERVRSFFGSFHSGNPNSADNERIDADLAREYGSTHEEQS